MCWSAANAPPPISHLGWRCLIAQSAFSDARSGEQKRGRRYSICDDVDALATGTWMWMRGQPARRYSSLRSGSSVGKNAASVGCARTQGLPGTHAGSWARRGVDASQCAQRKRSVQAGLVLAYAAARSSRRVTSAAHPSVPARRWPARGRNTKWDCVKPGKAAEHAPKFECRCGWRVKRRGPRTIRMLE